MTDNENPEIFARWDKELAGDGTDTITVETQAVCWDGTEENVEFVITFPKGNGISVISAFQMLATDDGAGTLIASMAKHGDVSVISAMMATGVTMEALEESLDLETLEEKEDGE